MKRDIFENIEFKGFSQILLKFQQTAEDFNQTQKILNSFEFNCF